MRRTKVELEEGRHPSFPLEEEKQRAKHAKILEGLQYAEASEIEEVPIAIVDVEQEEDAEEVTFAVFLKVFSFL